MNYSFSPRNLFITALLPAILLSWSAPAGCQAPKNDSLVTVSSRNIRIIVDQDQKAAKTWWTAWLAGYSAATIVQSGIAMTSPKLATRQDMWNSAATTLLGAAGVIITPLVPKKEEVEKQMTSDNEPDHIFSKDDYSIALLKEIARREEFGRSWKVQAVTIVVNAGSGLVTWLGFDRKFTDGLITFAINSVVTEAQIWSQPIRAKRDYENIIRARTQGRRASSPLPGNQWLISAFPGGASLKIRF